jgi:hypothetical protein
VLHHHHHHHHHHLYLLNIYFILIYGWQLFPCFYLLPQHLDKHQMCSVSEIGQKTEWVHTNYTHTHTLVINLCYLP